ncbi:Protein PLASTID TRANSCRIPTIONALLY ACTIVE 12, chloroplastic [Linum perenne]
MTSLQANWLYQDRGLRITVSSSNRFRRAGFSQFQSGLCGKRRLLPRLRCEKEDEEKGIEDVYVERAPYHSYLDSTSGQIEPASGVRPSIPGEELWPEGTKDRVRAASAPEPVGVSAGSPSYGQDPGSRRRKQWATSTASNEVIKLEPETMEEEELEPETMEEETTEEARDESSDYVIYETEADEEETGYQLDKKMGRPHPFIDPKAQKPIEGILPEEELWWNWKKSDNEHWSRWQRRKPDSETVFLKAMADNGDVKIFGEHPTLTETALYRARKHVYKEERLQAERDKLERIGPIAYYSEWVKNWNRDASREAVQKHFEETGEDETTQLMEMFSSQTDREYRIMIGTDVRVKRDPLAMRLREDQIKQIWGGDPVYPTINYKQDPNQIIDYRGPDFHEPTPNMDAFLKEHGILVTEEEFEESIGNVRTEEVDETTDMDEAMARAVDIGEIDEGEDSDVKDKEKVDEDSNLSRNWSVLKTTPELRKSKPKPKKEGEMSLDEAVKESENLTDFLMDFDQESE